jgi:hypothetical protein
MANTPQFIGCIGLATFFLAAGVNQLAYGQRQSQSRFGNQGPASQIGSNLTGSMVGQSTTFGNATGGLTGQPLSGNLGGAQYGTGLGATSFGTTGFGTGGLGGMQAGDSAFVGRDDTAGRFVGDQRVGQLTTPTADSRQFSNFGGNRGRGAAQAGFQQNMGRFGAQQNGNRSRSGVTGEAPRRVIRPRQEIAFPYPQHEAATVSTRLSTRFGQISSRQAELQGVSVEINAQGAAILTGTVATDEAEKLAGILARLEPGVRSVANQLTVAGSP